MGANCACHSNGKEKCIGQCVGLGDGECDEHNNNEVCSFDGGDCAEPPGK